MSCSGDSWETLSVDPDGLRVPEVVDALYELATSSGTFPADAVHRSRIFTMAGIALRKDSPWLYFRRAIIKGWILTAFTKSVDSEFGRKLRRQADERRKLRETVGSINSSIQSADPIHQRMTDEERSNSPFLKRYAEHERARTSADQKQPEGASDSPEMPADFSDGHLQKIQASGAVSIVELRTIRAQGPQG